MDPAFVLFGYMLAILLLGAIVVVADRFQERHARKRREGR